MRLVGRGRHHVEAEAPRRLLGQVRVAPVQAKLRAEAAMEIRDEAPAERFIDLLTKKVYPELHLYLSEDTASILAAGTLPAMISFTT